MKIKTVQEWIEWSEDIEESSDLNDDSQYARRLVSVDDIIQEINTMRDLPGYCKSYEWYKVLEELRDKLTQTLQEKKE